MKFGGEKRGWGDNSKEGYVQQELINLYKDALKGEQAILETIGNTGDTDKIMQCCNRIDQILADMAIAKAYGKKAEAAMATNGTKEALSKDRKSRTFKSFLNKEFLNEKFKSIGPRFGNIIKRLKYPALALMLQASPVLAPAQNKDVGPDDSKNKLEDTRTAKTTLEKNSEKTWSLDANWRFTTEDEKGNKESNIIGGLIAPFAVEVDVDKTTQGKTEVSIPLTYAHDFESTGFTNKEDAKKMEEYFRNQIRQQVANMLLRIGETEGVYRAHHKGESNLLENQFSKTKIKSIKITGFASPEASVEGAKSVIPGNKEAKNESLAKKRAEIAKSEIEKILKENNIDLSVLDSISYEEVQFSDTEMDKLTGLATSLGIKGSAPEDQILELVSRYNNGEYNENASVKKVMDEVVGNKRGANIEIEFENKEKKQVVVPIPLLLLLLLSRRIRRGLNPFNWRKRKEKDPIEPGEPKKLREIFSEKDIDAEKVAEGEFDYYEVYDNADKNIHGKDKQNIRNYFLKDELYPYLNDETSEQYGLDYMSLIQHTAMVHDRYDTEEELKTEIARTLIEMWQEYDRNVRREAGITIDEKTTLDYRHDEKKVLWAKIAAPEILNLAEKYRDNPESMAEELQRLLQKIEDNEDLATKKEEITGPWSNESNIKTPTKAPATPGDEKIPAGGFDHDPGKKSPEGIKSFEYDNLVSDLALINKIIAKNAADYQIEKGQLVSDYGMQRYQEEIRLGHNDSSVLFSRKELEEMRDKMENQLEQLKTEQANLNFDLVEINRVLIKNAADYQIEKGQLVSDYGMQRYQEEIRLGHNDSSVLFSRKELEEMRDKMEKNLSKMKKEPFNKLELALAKEQKIFKEFEDFVQKNPDLKIPNELEQRYKKAEEDLKKAKEVFKELEIALKKEREEFTIFEDFVNNSPDVAIPKTMEDRYRKAEERLKRAKKAKDELLETI